MAGITSEYTKNGDISFLTLSGEMDQPSFSKTFSEVNDLLVKDIKNIALLLDLSSIGYVNSGFIGHIANLFSLVDENNGKMAIIGNSMINDTFDLVGFGEFVDIVNSREKALTILNNFIGAKAFDFRFTD